MEIDAFDNHVENDRFTHDLQISGERGPLIIRRECAVMQIQVQRYCLKKDWGGVDWLRLGLVMGGGARRKLI